jgi:predicted small lipoprotein YifL
LPNERPLGDLGERLGRMSGFARASRLVQLLIAALLAATLSACGVRGSLENPQSAVEKQTADADSGQGKKEGEAAKPHKGFILDGLIR